MYKITQVGVKYWLTIGLLLLPFVWWPGAKVAFEVPRVIAFQGWVIGLAGLSIFHWKQAINIKLFGWLLVWLAVLGLSSRSTWVVSWLGNYYRQDGLVTQLLLVVMAISIGWSGMSKRSLLIVQSISSTLVATASLVAWAWTDGVVGLTFGNPHLLAGYLVVSLAGLVGLRSELSRKSGWIVGLGIAMHLGAIAATGADLVMALALVMLSWRYGFDSKTKIFPMVLTVGMMVGFLGWVFRPVTTFEAESRARMWHRGILAWQQKPMLGWGWAQFAQAIEKIAWPFPVQADVYVDKAHASLVETLVTTGVIGLVVYVMMWQQALTLSTNRGWLLMVVAYLLMSQLNVMSIMTEMLGWVGVGLALGLFN